MVELPESSRRIPEPDDAEGARQGGDAACWAHLVCPDCGAVEGDGHRAGCSRSSEE